LKFADFGYPTGSNTVNYDYGTNGGLDDDRRPV
jgi:hypothetical protein